MRRILIPNTLQPSDHSAHGDIPLPSGIVDRFSHGTAMAVVGYEVDQVRVDETTGEEVSVPISWAYNRRYTVNLYNRQKARLAKTATTPETARMGHGSGTAWIVEPLEDCTKKVNGGCSG
jgi:hypothetical protein